MGIGEEGDGVGCCTNGFGAGPGDIEGNCERFYGMKGDGFEGYEGDGGCSTSEYGDGDED